MSRGLLALALVLGVSSAARAEAPRLVILYVPCTVNKSFLSPYDGAVSYTPYLDRFVKDSVVFERHQTESGQSGIAYASIFSGSQSPGHGVYSHPQVLSEDLYLIGEAFEDAGYETHYWAAHPMAAGSLKYGQGVADKNHHDGLLIGKDKRLVRILRKLRRDPNARAFIMASFTVTHGPYNANTVDAFCQRFPDECKNWDAGYKKYYDLYINNAFQLSYNFPEASKALKLGPEEVRGISIAQEQYYKANVSLLDALFGRLVERIRVSGLLDQSLIAFTADHGEVLYRDGAPFKWTHGHALAPEVLNVPWIVRAPTAGVAPGRYAGVTRSMDVFPTLAGLAEVSIPAGTQVAGVDLAPTLRGDVKPKQLPGYSHTALIPEIVQERAKHWTLFRRFYPRNDIEFMSVALRQADRVFKYRHVGEGKFNCEYYDAASDPEEKKNLCDPANAEHMQMVAELKAYQAALQRSFRERDAADSSVPADQAERLRSLGYIE